MMTFGLIEELQLTSTSERERRANVRFFVCFDESSFS